MKLVTCPETAHVEGIECELDARGDIVRVLRCTRFDPPDAVTCGGECALRLDCRRSCERETGARRGTLLARLACGRFVTER
jgi:hypothetical protein